MKHIRKGACPHIYTQWCARVAGTADEDYRKLKKPEKPALLAALIMEQGALCAYTMRRIDDSSSHIEHLKPESVCRAERVGLDLEYGNLVACFPRDGMKKACRYGAHKKDNWWEDNGAAFVSPLHPACEQRFRFDLNGEVCAVQGDPAAGATINLLALNHPSLTEDRKRVIEEFIYGPSGSAPLSEAKTTRASSVICDRGADGRFHEFCVAIRDALSEHLKALGRNARNRRYARRRN